MYYEFNAPAGAINEIIILIIFIVAVLRVVIVSTRKKVEFNQYQEAREQHQSPDLKPITGYRQREGKAATAPPPRMEYKLSKSAPHSFEGGLTEERGEVAAPISSESLGLKRQPRAAKHDKTDLDEAYLIKDRHGSRLNLDPAALRKMIVIKELLDKPVSMREKRGYRIAR